MRKLVMTRGLPGSGKSTWASKQLEKYKNTGTRIFIICKDDIRQGLEKTGWKWSPEAEKEVISKRDSCIRQAFSMGVNIVISADTNFGKHKDALQKIAKECGADFEIKDFTNVDLATCIERDSKREKSVGEKVIRDMYDKYLSYVIQPYEPNPDTPNAIICDLDGTLALHSGRSPYDYSKCLTDKVNEDIALLLGTYQTQWDYSILLVSGRDGSAKELTEQWLKDHKIPYDILLMRGKGDPRKDYVVKLELFNENIRNNYNIRFVLDDRDQVVKMWRQLGLQCWQVAEGNF